MDLLIRNALRVRSASLTNCSSNLYGGKRENRGKIDGKPQTYERWHGPKNSENEGACCAL